MARTQAQIREDQADPAGAAARAAARAAANGESPGLVHTETVPAPSYGRYGGGGLPVRIGQPAEPREHTDTLITVEPFEGGEDSFTDVGGTISFEGDMEAAWVVINAMKGVSRRRINVTPQPNNRPGGEETRIRFGVSFHIPS